VPQAFTEPTPQEHILIQVEPEALIFVKNGKVTHHIMTAALAFQHRHRQILDRSPTRLQAASIVPIAQHSLLVSTATMATLPVNLAWLAAHATDHAFLSSQFGAHFRF
jgi:hypothetical protein